MTNAVERPSGDSHGTRGETVVPLRLRPRRLRTLRERQLALLVICAGALVAIVDSSAVYVALPDIQRGLDFSPTTLPWVVNAYLVPFGGLLLLAGKVGDAIGAKRVFIGGLALFTAASLVCGLATSPAVLIAARFLQGTGGAMTTAVVLGMIVTMFPNRREQSRALGLYAFVASSAAATGLLAGAALTQWLSWQWIFFVNLPIGALTIVAACYLLDNVLETRERDGIDWFGSIALVAALMLTVYTIAQSADHGWGNNRTLLLGGGALLLGAVFVAWQTRARHPLIPLDILRKGNLGRSSLVLALMVAGPAAMFFLTSLYLREVLGFTVLEVGFGFLPAAVAVGVGSLKIAPRLLRRVEPKTVLSPAIAMLALGLLLLARIPADGNYFVDVLPAILLIGAGSGLATPPVLQLALADATTRDSGLRSGLINTTQQIGSAVGLAVLAPIAAATTAGALRAGEPLSWSLTSGYRTAFLVGAGMTVVALLLGVVLVRPETVRSAPESGAASTRRTAGRHRDPTGASDSDFLAVGMGGTNMMAMLWSIAMGRRAVGVELRGDPFINLMHWNVNRDLYHHFALVDKMMLERYGEDRIPRLPDGRLFRLHECFYLPGAADGSGARTDEILSGWLPEAHMAGLIESTEVVDDRWVAGRPNRECAALTLPDVGAGLDPTLVGRDIGDVLAEPHTFLVAAEEMLILMRRYLEEMERMDLAAGVTPRCRMFLYHQVAQPAPAAWLERLLPAAVHRWLPRSATDPGFLHHPDGRVQIRIEALREVDHKGRFQRIRDTSLPPLDLGTPELIMIAEGVTGTDATRLGLRQEVVTIDRQDGRGPVPAQADYVYGLLGVYVNNNSRRRIGSIFDQEGAEHWVRQAVVGHEDYAESAWTVAEVPDFMRFDPVMEGIVKPGVSRRSAEYYGGYRYLIREYHLEQAALLTGLPKTLLAKTQSLSTPRLVTVTSKIGVDAQLAANVVVGGDSFGSGSILTTGAAMTGILGHSCRVLRYWEERSEGTSQAVAIRRLADRIKEDTATYLQITHDDFAQPARAPQRDGRRGNTRRHEKVLESARRHRRTVARFNYRDDWSRLQVVPGRLHLPGLPMLTAAPPEAGPEVPPPTGDSPTLRESAMADQR